MPLSHLAPTAPRLGRRALLVPLLLAACGHWERADQSSRTMEPLHYDHLAKLRLNVAVVDVEDRYVPAGREDVGKRAPVPPLTALRQMAQDRLQAMGGNGRAVFIIKRASLVENRGAYDGDMDVELAIYGPDNARVAFAEARVSRHQSSDGPAREVLYDMVRKMMDTMNVELEYQARRNLRGWLLEGDPQAAPGEAVPAPVEQQDLSPLRAPKS